MNFPLFPKISDSQKDEVITSLIEHSSSRPNFFFMIVLAIVLATIGLIINNVTVVIGSMLIAPLLYPLMSTGLGVAISDSGLVIRSIITILKAVLLGVGVSVIVTLFLIPPGFEPRSELLTRSAPTIPYIAVAVFAGIAAAYSMALKELSERLIGVAVSVALIPPIAVIGIGLGRLDFIMARGATVLFITSALGIIAACAVIFSMFRFYTERTATKKIIQKDDNQLKYVSRQN